jgi:predicted transcriptional regulator
MTENMRERLDAAREANESRLDVIREAIERELKRRERRRDR